MASDEVLELRARVKDLEAFVYDVRRELVLHSEDKSRGRQLGELFDRADELLRESE